jgi:hypothetical protein
MLCRKVRHNSSRHLIRLRLTDRPSQKGLGLGMVVGGAILKLPQIAKIVSSKSTRGLSLSAFVSILCDLTLLLHQLLTRYSPALGTRNPSLRDHYSLLRSKPLPLFTIRRERLPSGFERDHSRSLLPLWTRRQDSAKLARSGRMFGRIDQLWSVAVQREPLSQEFA